MSADIASGAQDLLVRYLHLNATFAIVLVWLILAFVVVNFVMAIGGLMSYIMRKLMARIQSRIGPNRVGPMGLLQFLADGLKMVAKEDVVPAAADPWAFKLAPYFVIIPVMIAFAPLPWGNGIVAADVRYGFLVILAVSAAAPIGEIMAGWASNNKYSILGALRAAVMDVSYEVPLILAAISVILLASSLTHVEGGAAVHYNGLNTFDLANAQGAWVWFIFLQPIGAFIFFAAALAKAGVVPTDLAESESELVAGFATEYSGMRFGLLYLSVFVQIVFISMMTVLLFFGGWSMPFVPDWGWITTLLGLVFFFAKTAVFVIFTILVWFTLPRVRPDQLLSFGWKILFPLSLLNLVLALVEIRYLVPGSPLGG
ncbi:MAG: NADH-quinone oxidoreductase subunit NuoH [Thermoplasmatota archaeon]